MSHLPKRPRCSLRRYGFPQHICTRQPGLEAWGRQRFWRLKQPSESEAGDGESSSRVGHRQRQLSCENGLFLPVAQWQAWQRACGGLQESSKRGLLDLLQQLVIANEALIQRKFRHAWCSCLVKLLPVSWRVKAALEASWVLQWNPTLDRSWDERGKSYSAVSNSGSRQHLSYPEQMSKLSNSGA